RLLALEMAVDRSLRDLGAARDLVHRGGLDAGLEEHFRRRREHSRALRAVGHLRGTTRLEGSGRDLAGRACGHGPLASELTKSALACTCPVLVAGEELRYRS